MTIDAIFTVKQLIEKKREYNIETCIAFIDFQKAFDSLDRLNLWNILIRRGFPLHLIKAINILYDGTPVVIESNEKLTE